MSEALGDDSELVASSGMARRSACPRDGLLREIREEDPRVRYQPTTAYA